jgi:ubiquitin carboxyl-terminal hydrolase 7
LICINNTIINARDSPTRRRNRCALAAARSPPRARSPSKPSSPTRRCRVLLCFPRGNHPRADPPSLSLYLAAAAPDDEPWGWGRAASFKLSMLNANPDATLCKDTQHRFSAAQVDWGFTNFAPVEAAAAPARGFNAGGAVRFRVELTITSPDVAAYDSRAATGFVGLKNQGATCYMNSLLQTLYNVNAFRRAVYRMPTSEDDAPAASMPLALQSVFYKLQFTPGPVSTKDLTASFGWDTADAFQQHDVQVRGGGG